MVISKKQISYFAGLRQKKVRRIEGKMLVEGYLPVLEAVRSDYIVTDLVYTPYIKDKQGFEEILAADGRHYEVDAAVLKKISTEVTPQGILAVVEEREFRPADLNGSLMCTDAIQDPGNLGTMLRIAHWFGLGAVILLGDCVDISNPKCIRSSKGSIFHIPHVKIGTVNELRQNFPKQRLLIADAHEGRAAGEFRSLRDDFILVIGNESHGVSDAWKKITGEHITLAALGGAESLNAAMASAAILALLKY